MRDYSGLLKERAETLQLCFENVVPREVSITGGVVKFEPGDDILTLMAKKGRTWTVFQVATHLVPPPVYEGFAPIPEESPETDNGDSADFEKLKTD